MTVSWPRPVTVSWWQLLGAVKPVTVSWRKLLEAVKPISVSWRQLLEAVKRRWWVSVLALAMATIAPHLAIEAGERINVSVNVSVEQREVRIATSVCVLLMVVNSAANGLHTAGSTGI